MEVEGDKLDSFGGQVVILLSKTRVCEVRVVSTWWECSFICGLGCRDVGDELGRVGDEVGGWRTGVVVVLINH